MSKTLEQIQQLWIQLSPSERETHLEWGRNHCAQCGRPGTWKGGEPMGAWCCQAPPRRQARRALALQYAVRPPATLKWGI
jgi:hypothetical protein